MPKVLGWMDWYHELEKYYSQHGDIDVPYYYKTSDGLMLGKWLDQQKVNYLKKKNNRLTKEQIDLLNKLGMMWEQWDRYYSALEKYYEENGDINVPYYYKTENDLNLGRWLCEQKRLYREKSEKITKTKIEKLEKLKINWNSINDLWLKNYEALKIYYEEHGNIDVPKKYETEEGIKLGLWLCRQRLAYKGKGRSKITEEQIQLLNNLGMIWNRYTNSWLKYYTALKKYYQEHGNIDIIKNYETEDGIKLGKWLNNQRQAYKGKGNCKINENQIQLLNDLGMKWEVIKETWDNYYSALKEYYREHENIDVPYNYETKEGLKLGEWLYYQRLTCKNIEREELLNKLGMIWDISMETWDEKYYALEEYYKEHGNIDVPTKYETKDGIKLGYWVSVQRKAYKEEGTCKITEDQIQLLNDLGMKWEIKKETWDDYYSALKKYYEEHGNIDVPEKYETEEGIKLGSWLCRQRLAYKGKGKSKITESQVQLLNDLGMKWEFQKETWDDYYSALEEYYKEHGNIDVPKNYETKDGVKLGRWLGTQRQAYKGKGKVTNKINENQIQLLNNLGMVWEVQKENWYEKYYALEEYYKEHGNIDVPKNYETKDGTKLGIWLDTQRSAYKGKGNNKIADDQIQLLNNLGMKWQIQKENWYENYYALEEYYKEHENIDVPTKYETEEGLKLGKWLRTQRQSYKGKGTNKITQDQIQLLNNLKIDWCISDTKLLNMKIEKDNKDKYYKVLNDRLEHMLTDLSYEVSNEITEENQGELCKQIVKRMWR